MGLLPGVPNVERFQPLRQGLLPASNDEGDQKGDQFTFRPLRVCWSLSESGDRPRPVENVRAEKSHRAAS